MSSGVVAAAQRTTDTYRQRKGENDRRKTLKEKRERNMLARERVRTMKEAANARKVKTCAALKRRTRIEKMLLQKQITYSKSARLDRRAPVL